jgi:hypothetical protein
MPTPEGRVGGGAEVKQEFCPRRGVSGMRAAAADSKSMALLKRSSVKVVSAWAAACWAANEMMAAVSSLARLGSNGGGTGSPWALAVRAVKSWFWISAKTEREMLNGVVWARPTIKRAVRARTSS